MERANGKAAQQLRETQFLVIKMRGTTRGEVKGGIGDSNGDCAIGACEHQFNYLIVRRANRADFQLFIFMLTIRN